MKKILIFPLLFASFAIAQAPKTVTITEQEKLVIDLHQTKLENIQLQANNLQTEAQNKMKAFGEEYQTEQKALNEAIEAARKAHQLDDKASFDSKSFVFNVYPKEIPKTEKK